jgi:hypothetical protein
MAGFRTAFFAFPSGPAELKDPIELAVALANRTPDVAIQGWPQLEIFGAVIPDEIRAGIENANVLICDVTRPNLNVYYEVGFAVGLGKSIAPVLNASFVDAASNIQKDGLFDVIGYRAYENSLGLVELITNLPDSSLLELYGKPQNTQQPIYFLNSYRKTDFMAAIGAAIKDSKVHFRSFDPAEISRFSIIQAVTDLTSSAGVIVPFLGSYIEDATRHNLRAAFLAGLAHGLERDALLLRHGAIVDEQVPLDFRENIVGIRSELEIRDKVIAFCAQTLIAAQSIRKPTKLRTTTGLQRLSLGATAAENEFRTLDEYFLATAEYLRTQRGEAELVAGRKGSGKTAIFFMVRDSFRQQKNSIVTDLRPESHQLSLFKSELTKILDTGTFDHTIASFWYFVVLTEILLSLKKEAEFQSSRSPTLLAEANEIDRALASLGVSDSGDFTARINRLGSYVLDEIKASESRREQLTPEKLTNVVFRGGIADAKRLLLKYSSKTAHLVFLIDNIDKGWASDGVDELDVKLVRLLVEALEKVKRDLATDHRDFIFVIFLRNDVFELMVSETPDKGKAAIVRIDWTDRVKLKQLIYLRLQASVVAKAHNFDEIWNRFFVAQINGRETFDYFVDHCLMRPRFLIAIIENAIANAINRGHDKVLEDDAIDAVRQHSHSILNDFGYEIRDVSGVSEKVLLSLVGATRYITKGEVIERFQNAKLEGDLDKLFAYMLWYGVIGVVSMNNSEKYIYDYEYNVTRLVAEVEAQKEEPLYVINPALHAALTS